MFCMAHEQHFQHEKLLVFKHLFVEYSTSVLLVYKYATAVENTPILDRVLNRFRSEWIGIFSIH